MGGLKFVHLALVLSGVPLIGESHSHMCHTYMRLKQDAEIGWQCMPSDAGTVSAVGWGEYQMTCAATPHVLLCPACTTTSPVLLCPVCTALSRQTLASARTSVQERQPTLSSHPTSASVCWPRNGGRRGTSGLQPWPSPSGGKQHWLLSWT